MTALLLAFVALNPPGDPPSLGNRPSPAPAGVVAPPHAAAPVQPKAPPVQTPPPQPYQYQRADATGKVWSSHDPFWLKTWVDQVNATLIRPASVPWYPARQYCPNGRCPR